MTNMYNIGIYLVTCTSPLLLKIHGTNTLANLEKHSIYLKNTY